MATPIADQDLILHVLNVGMGDCILIELPADATGERSYAMVDCAAERKARTYLGKLRQLRRGRPQLVFLCATHPHQDHIRGIEPFLSDLEMRPAEFWDSGFRHGSTTYQSIMKALLDNNVRLVRVSAGMEWYFGRVQITALAPSVWLRNRYGTYGVDINNASIVLRIEHRKEDMLLIRSLEYSAENPALEDERKAGQSVVILAGDAEFDSWGHITQDFPRLETTAGPLVRKMVNYLACSVIKVAHHGSMHSASLDVYEKMMPEAAIVSTEQEIKTTTVGGRPWARGLFPHPSTIVALQEWGARVYTTDGSYESEAVNGGAARDAELAYAGSIVVVVPPGGRPRLAKLHDKATQVPDPPAEV